MGTKVGVHTWRLNTRTNLEFERLLKRRLDIPDDSDEAYALEEQIRSLPGFPRNVDPNIDVILREVTTVK